MHRSNKDAQKTAKAISLFCPFADIHIFMPLCAALLFGAVFCADDPVAACNSSTYWVTGLRMNWTDAYSYCAARNGTLPVIHNSCVNDLVASVSPPDTWLGGTRLQPYSNNTNQFQWVANMTFPQPFFDGTTSSGSCMTYCSFVATQPDDLYGNQLCIRTNFNGILGQWDDDFCTMNFNVVCEVSVCPSGWYSSGQLTCLSCPPGSYNSLAGQNSSAACIQCAVGTYSLAGQSSCFPCVDNSDCVTAIPSTAEPTTAIPSTTEPITAELATPINATQVTGYPQRLTWQYRLAGDTSFRGRLQVRPSSDHDWGGRCGVR
jgi:hypothetical protein